MADKLLIAISARQVSVARWRGRGFDECNMFTYSDAGLNTFKEYLTRIPKLPVHIMVDAVEEDYRVESLPHSFGSARTEMVTRRLKQYYRNTPYFSAHLQTREEGKRRDDRYLFCALTNPDLITGWVQAAVAREMPIAGIYLLPTVSQGLVEKLQIKHTNLLVVSTESSGLRLTFFRDQMLRLSRLARIDTTSPDTIKNFGAEITNTRIYLQSLRIVTADEQLSILVVDANDTLHELAEIAARDNAHGDARRLGRQEILARIGLSPRALDSSGDALYLHLLGLRAPANNIAPPDVTVGYRHHRARRGIYVLTGASALAMSVWLAFNWYQISDIDRDIRVDIADAARQTAQLRKQYEDATRQFPAAPTSAENMRRAVEVAQKIGTALRTPETMMQIVSQALDRSPNIQLKGLGWRYATAEFEGELTQSSKQSDAAPQGLVGPARKQSALIEAEVRPFRGDYRSALDTINRFAQLLQQQPQVAEVKLVRLPLNISPTLTLSGNTRDSGEQAGQAEFRVLVVLKPSV